MPDSGASESSPLLRARPHASAPLSWVGAREVARAVGEEGRPAVTEASLADALGATLGADLVSPIDVPALDSAAMDGYAVSGTGPWILRGRSTAGHPTPVARLRAGEAVGTATGAVVPSGTGAVLPHEHATLSSGVLSGRIATGRHVRRRGETTAVGSVAARAGAPVTPALLGLAASLGRDTLPVLRPRVGVLVTGDEVVRAGTPRPGTVRDAIGPMLPGVVSRVGGVCAPGRPVADGRDDLARALSRVAEDVVAVCGSSSAGPADHLRSVLTGLGARVAVDGVACRPGHPQVLAVLPSGTVVVGLPGNPGAALVAALTLLVPLLCGRAGRPDPAHRGRRVLFAGTTWSHRTDTRLVPVRVGHDMAVELPTAGSADLRAVAVADALAVIPPVDEADGSAPVPERVELVEVPT
ncbi:molybdopterin molybdotransferase MoeA [Nocardiopsis sp. MG754419]|uniref:molybdopterin molybdotransferase MoeA n=1 Tax=Nocardiopsis sp. MG754419 TaxID=2259865 RepID=UPI001BAC3444|nr:molybdopterin molybdotransferase MoeA [Nocardiopsis sp. MG754419]MBR8744218.1 molybdopterin molybdenumtransferase MoeA [Nocardiopsis sp. MG754419]